MSRRTAGRLGKMPTTSVRRRISLLRRSWGLFDQTCVQWTTGNAVKARTSGPASSAQHARVLRVDLLRRRLLIDRPDHGRHPGLGAAGDSGEQVGHEVGAAALPRGPGEDRGNGVLQPLMVVGGHQLDPALRPRAVSERRNASHNAPSPLVPTSIQALRASPRG